MTDIGLGEVPGSKWVLQPGDEIERKQLHSVYGGRTQGGIGPSARTPNVMIFADPVAGEKFGYYDGWMPDGLFHYTGEGQYGDQRMLSGNASILNHQAEGRALRVFQGARGRVRYVGEFAADGWYQADAPEFGDGPLRKVIVFRLRPLDIEPQRPATKLGRILESQQTQVQTLGIEQQETEKSFVDPSRDPYEAERREAKLVLAFSDYLRSRGHEVVRQMILPTGESRPLFTDLYDSAQGLLIEAKGSVTRENFRMAIGQLADYGRFVEVKSSAILVPSEPREDLLELAKSQDVAVIWPEGKGYVGTRPDLLN
ncbi:restriction endonuclease [Kitasatospora sp. NPDC089509]|uniref:restriction endonuclease n=1 Tax=Kitasatospora sp. NPDC089509 TaxID=3364079 RepID=UPI0037FBF2C0